MEHSHVTERGPALANITETQWHQAVALYLITLSFRISRWMALDGTIIIPENYPTCFSTATETRAAPRSTARYAPVSKTRWFVAQGKNSQRIVHHRRRGADYLMLEQASPSTTNLQKATSYHTEATFHQAVCQVLPIHELPHESTVQHDSEATVQQFISQSRDTRKDEHRSFT